MTISSFELEFAFWLVASWGLVFAICWLTPTKSKREFLESKGESNDN